MRVRANLGEEDPEEDADGATERVRYVGDRQALAGLMMKHAKMRGKKWVKYDSVANVQKAKLNIEGVLAHMELVTDMHALQSNLAFRKSDAKASLEEMLTTMAVIWKMTAEQQTDYIDVMEKRFRNLGHTVNKFSTKTYKSTPE